MKNGNSNELKDKTILLVNTGSLKKKFIIQRLKALGLKVIVLNKEKNWAEPYVDQWILADTFNHTEAIQSVKQFLNQNPEIKIDGALTFWEDDVLLTSKIIDKFNFIGTPFNVAKKIRNKYLFREFCRQHNLPAPNYKLLRKAEDLKFVVANFKFPLVIKPAFGSSSAYVVKVENEEELNNTYEYIKSNLSTNIESSLSDGLDIFVEEYIDGDEVDIDMLIQNGKLKFHSISDNFKTREPFFVETGQAIPSTLPLRDQLGLAEIAEMILEKLGVQNSCVHFEAKMTKDGPVPIEINLRMGGDEVHSFVKGAWHVDLIEQAVRICLGSHFEKIKRPEIPYKYLIGSYFLPDNSGIMVKFDLPESVKSHPCLEELHVYKKIGDPVLVPPEGYEFIGWLVVSGNNSLDAEDNFNDISKKIQYEVARFQSTSSVGRTLRRNRFSEAVLNKNLLIKAAKMERVKMAAKADQKNLQIGLTGNAASGDEDSPEKISIIKPQEALMASMQELGFTASFFDFNNPAEALAALKNSSVDLVFNARGKVKDSYLLEPLAAAILEILDTPFTGSTSYSLALCTDKINVKKLLNFHNIPTPKWDCAYTLKDEISDSLEFPLIVKPGNANNSLGVTNESVVTNKEQLKSQVEKIISSGQPALVEEYIEGEEYHVSILGSDESDLRVLPLERMIFKDLPENLWHIYSYEAKWSKDPMYNNLVVERPSTSTNKRLETVITEIALDAYTIVDCHDYGIVDIRVDKDNNPYVLEINPNPNLNPEACLPLTAKLIGLTYPQLLAKIIDLTVNRYAKKINPAHFQDGIKKGTGQEVI